MTKEPQQIDNWRIEHVYLDETMTMSAPVIKGLVEGRLVKPGILLWFDLEKRVAMTENHIFKIGDPNRQWMGHFLAAGHDPEDLEIKDTNH
jgi:hypothetical protein